MAKRPPRCMCDFPPTCGGYGSLQCVGCGGDQCVCAACFDHGERDCDGCHDCTEPSDQDFDMPEDAWA